VTTPVSGIGATPTGAATATAPLQDPAGKDMFMKLLVAQMKYQNPMEPKDGGEYMSQMALFTQIEKLSQLVESQQAAQAWQQRLSAEGLVGKQVTGTANDHTSHTGIVTSVQLGDGEPLLTLSDGSKIAVGEISTVEQAS